MRNLIIYTTEKGLFVKLYPYVPIKCSNYAILYLANKKGKDFMEALSIKELDKKFSGLIKNLYKKEKELRKSCNK